jgi:hypothetical protein
VIGSVVEGSASVQAAGDAQPQLHALIVAAPEVLGERTRTWSTHQLVAACARLRVDPDWEVETGSTAATQGSLDRRSRELTAEPAAHRQAILALGSVVLTRLRTEPATRACATRRRAQARPTG